MAQHTISTLNALKQQGKKFACLTAYDACFARLLSQTGIEVLLVGDSLGMVLQGHDSTLPVTVDDMVYHTTCVAQGNDGAFVMADLPFMSYANEQRLFDASARLMQAGAHAIKLEGEAWLNSWLPTLSHHGIPVCVHMGLTPQSVNTLGGYKVQGRNPKRAQDLQDAAIAAEQHGAALLLLECVPTALATTITQSVSIPVIGIGAGPHTDGHVLVLHDAIGISPGKAPKFVKNFMPDSPDGSIQGAVRAYLDAVHQERYPNPQHGFE